MDKILRRIITGIVVYVVMVFFTNAYCQVHRWDDWSTKRQTYNGRLIESNAAEMKTMFASILWPVYWLSRGCLFLVEHPPRFALPPPVSVEPRPTLRIDPPGSRPVEVIPFPQYKPIEVPQ